MGSNSDNHEARGPHSPEDLERLLQLVRERSHEPRDPTDRTWSIYGWDIDAEEERTLTVYYTGGAGDLEPQLEVEESPDEIVLRLRIEQAPGAFRRVGYSREITYRLYAPLAGRPVLSGGPLRRPLERGRRY